MYLYGTSSSWSTAMKFAYYRNQKLSEIQIYVGKALYEEIEQWKAYYYNPTFTLRTHVGRCLQQKLCNTFWLNAKFNEQKQNLIEAEFLGPTQPNDFVFFSLLSMTEWRLQIPWINNPIAKRSFQSRTCSKRLLRFFSGLQYS